MISVVGLWHAHKMVIRIVVHISLVHSLHLCYPICMMLIVASIVLIHRPMCAHQLWSTCTLTSSLLAYVVLDRMMSMLMLTRDLCSPKCVCVCVCVCVSSTYIHFFHILIPPRNTHLFRLFNLIIAIASLQRWCW
jgi:hypothetical protein